MSGFTNASGLRLEEQVRDLIDRTIERFSCLKGAEDETEADGQGGVGDGTA